MDGKNGRSAKPVVGPKGDPLIYRIIHTTLLFVLILVAVGCICTARDSNIADGEDKISLSSKQQGGTKKTESESGNAQEYVAGQVLIKLKTGTDPSVLDKIAEDLGLETVKPLALPDTYLMQITGDDSVDTVIKNLELYDVVKYSEPNYTIQPERKSE